MSDRVSASRKRLERPSRNRRSAASPEWERFETRLDRLLAAIARAPAVAVDQEIEHWLGQIVLTLDIDRTTVWDRTHDDRGFVPVLLLARPEVPPQPAGLFTSLMQISPWATAQILAGEIVVYGRFEEIPKEAEKLRAFVQKCGPLANVMMPLQIESTIIGALSFGKFRAPREWSPKLLRRLRMVAQVFAGALDRKRIDAQIGTLQQQVATAARRSTMGELAAAIAHELNQPLAAIIGNASAVRRSISRKNPDSKDVGDALADIIEDGKRANEIIHRVRALFRGDDRAGTWRSARGSRTPPA